MLGGDARQCRPASWDTLIVALIKLVCTLIQTPLPNVRIFSVYSSIFLCIQESLKKFILVCVCITFYKMILYFNFFVNTFCSLHSNVFSHVLQTRQDHSEESTEMELSETWSSKGNASDSQNVNTWQTDESKAAEQRNSFHLQQPKTNKSSVPCLADTGNY